MSRARLTVEQAGPLTTLQDRGRPGYMRFGVARSGPVDRLAFAAAHAAAGNDAGGTAIEVSLGGVALRCNEGAVGFALTGGDFTATLDGRRLGSWHGGTLHAGETLVVREGAGGNWGYIALAGQPVARDWLGSTATHAPAGLGGGRLDVGQVMIIDNARDCDVLAIAAPNIGGGPIRIVTGPQERFFPADALAALTTADFRPSTAFDRMGVVLVGPPMVPTSLAMLSEPLVRGAIQINGAGVATVLLADHQTTGGYPKIATVITADLDRLAQLRAGSSFQFHAVDVATATGAARTAAASAATYLAGLRTPLSLAERLLSANLIDGVADARAE